MTNAELINIEVAYALPEQQVVIEVQVQKDLTVEEAINVSGVLHSHPEIDLGVNKVGIFGKLVKLSQPIREKDRIEIYRPLIADPKEVRKMRAAQGRKIGKGAREKNKNAAIKPTPGSTE